VPDAFKGNIGNCVIALEMAHRMGANPMAVMQNLYIVHGRPGWSAQFIIACLNQCQKFSPLRFRMSGEGENYQCIAWAKELESGEILEGPPVSMLMAKKENWSTKNGSKWQTMPELMLRYRAATFFGRLYAPDLLMGMQTAEELGDFRETSGRVVETAPKGLFPLVTAIEDKEEGLPLPTFSALSAKLDDCNIGRSDAVQALKQFKLLPDETDCLADITEENIQRVLSDWESFIQACEEVAK
jgi:hypothetical protein